MTRTPPPPRGGIAGMWLLFCVAALLVGLGLDFFAGARAQFWIGGEAGVAALIGVSGGVFALLGARLVRFVFGRTIVPDGGGRDARIQP